MKKIIYILSLVLLVLFSNSCEDQYDEEPTIVTTEDLLIKAELPLDNYLGSVLGLSTKSAANFSLITTSVEGAINLDSQGNITVANDNSFFLKDLDLTQDPPVANKDTLNLTVLVSKDGVQSTSNVKIFVDFRDTDGDGVIEYDEIANNTDLNDPCDPAQDAGYKGFNIENRIWAAADCDGDGALNGDDNEPYFPCVDNVDTSIWEGPVVVVDGSLSTTTTATSSCRTITLMGDLVGFSFDEDCSKDTVTLLFEPESEGATKGTVTIPDQLYLDICVGFEDRIRSIGEGTYDEETGIILVDYVVYFDEFDPALINTDYFPGTISVKPE